MTQKSNKEQKAALVEAYKSVFRGDAGRLVLDDLMMRYHILRSRDPSTVNLDFAEGQRDVVLYLLDRVNTTPEMLDHVYGESKAKTLEWADH